MTVFWCDSCGFIMGKESDCNPLISIQIHRVRVGHADLNGFLASLIFAHIHLNNIMGRKFRQLEGFDV